MDALSIQGRFLAQVRRTPNATAVSCGPIRLTYRELNERSNQLAHYLLELGVGPDAPVGIAMERSADLVTAIVAVTKTGGPYLPLHTAYPLERMQWIMEDAGAAVLLTDEAMRARGLPAGSHTTIAVPDGRHSAFPARDTAVSSEPSRLAYVIYTSGSTGHPKGVGVTHQGVLSLVDDPCWDGGRHDRVLMVAPHAFSVSAYELWVPLLRGGQVVVSPPGLLDVAALRRTIAENDITGIHLTAGLFRVLAEEAPDCLAGVREVLTGGDVISPTAVRRVLAACPGTVVRAMYGATETTLFTTTAAMIAPYDNDLPVPVGHPMADVRAYVLDERLQPVPAGTIGELYLGGPRLARGYYRRPDLTADHFVADPFANDGQRMYRTGDLVRLTPKGMVDFIGRATDQVKIRGFRVELAEVEAVLARHPGMANVAVIARQAEPGATRLAAYVVAGPDGVSIAELRAHAQASLPDYMVPAAFVMLDRLPLTPNGKLDRRALPDVTPDEQNEYRAPRTARQETLCKLFADLLGVTRVGIDDSFFNLSGDSLQAVRIVSRIQAELTVSVSVNELFDAPTVAELDDLITNRAGPEASENAA